MTTSNVTLSLPPFEAAWIRGGFPVHNATPAANSRDMNLYALTKERGTDLVNMTRLLGDTRAPEWQRALRNLLASYIQHGVMRQAVTFLSDNIERAIQALRRPDLFPGFPCLYIHTENKPIIFDIDLWKAILIALNFEITEPEGNRHIDLIEVKIAGNVTESALVGFHILLDNISKLSWENIRLVLYMEENEQLHFLHAIQEQQRSQGDIANQALVRSLYERQTGAMESLGFHRIRGVCRHARKDIAWERPDTEQLDYIEVVLFGLFHHGRGLETYI